MSEPSARSERSEEWHRTACILCSVNCGVDFSPLGYCQLRTDSAKNRELLREACALSESERERLRRQTVEHYDEFHASFEDLLPSYLDDLLNGATNRGRRSMQPAPVAGGAKGNRDSVRPRDRARRRYLVARARWLNSWNFHQKLGSIRRKLPI